jgi:hypothetical protein
MKVALQCFAEGSREKHLVEQMIHTSGKATEFS